LVFSNRSQTLEQRKISEAIILEMEHEAMVNMKIQPGLHQLMTVIYHCLFFKIKQNY